MKRHTCGLAIAAALVFLSSCAHGPSTRELGDPKILIVDACEPGTRSQAVKGSVWMNARSKDAKGQFPANVMAKAPDSLTLEVINLIGGTQALITIEGKKYSIVAPDREGKNQKHEGQGSWGGIPLKWASDLFLGRIPCPSKELLTGAKLSVQDQQLVVEVGDTSGGGGAEKFIYSFRSWGGKAWPERLHWERVGTLAAAVDFKFDDPEDKTHSPRKWEAKSAQGEVKVRWRDRETAP